MEYLIVFKSSALIEHNNGEFAHISYTERLTETEDNNAILYAERKSDWYDWNLLHVHNTTNNKTVYSIS